MDSSVQTLLAILFLPLASAALIACFLRRRTWAGAVVSVLAALGIMLLSLKFIQDWDGETISTSITWLQLGDFKLELGVLFEGQVALMLLVVGVVSFFIHLFSVGYMDEDKSKGRYFAGLSIFMFSMLGIVFSHNLIMLFIFWELVGFSSYMLIAHYYETSFASWASKKAFIVNRVGDFGFLLGIIWTYWHFGTVSFEGLRHQVMVNPDMVKTAIGLLLMCGFLGKSAQFPLQVWLPDAMAGPTPVSALIHAATMVAAGIYLLARIAFMLSPEVLEVIIWLAAIMTAYAGFCALGQRDIKKILAYSTLSQLGYMAVGIGLNLPGLALFHMATHACFKATLFLSAGSIIHALHHEQDIFKMGGLFKRMPITSGAFLIGTLALCALFGTSGYFSKDSIIVAAYLHHRPVFYVVLFSAFLTAFYMGRVLWVVFFGPANSKAAESAKESSWFMTLPLIILSVLSLLAGYEFLWPHVASIAFEPEVHVVHEAILQMGLSVHMLLYGSLAWALGLGLSLWYYGLGASADRMEAQSPQLYCLFESKLWWDELYNAYVSKVQQRFADILAFLDLIFISGLLVRGSAGLVGLAGLVFRMAHVGSIQIYVYWFLAGVLIFWGFAVGLF